MAESNTTLLQVDKLCTGYGKRRVCNDITIEVNRNEVVAIIGHNGAGKSTLLKAIYGLLPCWNGTISIDGTPMLTPQPRIMIRAGLAFFPQGNRVFRGLTVYDNLVLSGRPGSATFQSSLEAVFDFFPILKRRLHNVADALSGGEKQMLSLARCMFIRPQLMLIDEPTLGLSPTLRSEVFNWICNLSCAYNSGVLIVEQNVREVLGIAGRVYVLRQGSVSFEGMTRELQDKNKLRDVYL